MTDPKPRPSLLLVVGGILLAAAVVVALALVPLVDCPQCDGLDPTIECWSAGHHDVFHCGYCRGAIKVTLPQKLKYKVVQGGR